MKKILLLVLLITGIGCSTTASKTPCPCSSVDKPNTLYTTSNKVEGRLAASSVRSQDMASSTARLLISVDQDNSANKLLKTEQRFREGYIYKVGKAVNRGSRIGHAVDNLGHTTSWITGNDNFISTQCEVNKIRELLE